MIAVVEGQVLSRGLDEVVLMTAGGVGYRLVVSLQTLACVPPEGERARLYVHTHVREDALQLFGFHDPEERAAFLLLVSISGVGPRLALALLSTISVHELARAVQAGDIRRLSAAPGVGKKTAERIALELREKLPRLAGDGDEDAGAAAPAPASAALDDLRSALLNLGYRTAAVERVAKKLEAELDGAPAPRLEDLVRRALQLVK